MKTEIKIKQTDYDFAKQLAMRRQEVDRTQGRIDLKYHPNRTSFDVSFMGTLAEVIFHKTFDIKTNGDWVQLKGNFGADFITNENKKIELKSTDRQKPFVKMNLENYSRKKSNGLLSDYTVFALFDDDFKFAYKLIVIGYIKTSDIEKYPINPDGYDISPAYRIPITDLLDITEILKIRIEYTEGM